MQRSWRQRNLRQDNAGGRWDEKGRRVVGSKPHCIDCLCYSGHACTTTGQQEPAQKCSHHHSNVGIEETNRIPRLIIKNACIQKRKVLCFYSLKVKSYILSSLNFFFFSNYSLNLLGINHLEVVFL